MADASVELGWRAGGECLQLRRDELFDALSSADVDPAWVEWQMNDPRAPRYIREGRDFGVYVNGRALDALDRVAIRRAMKTRPRWFGAGTRLAPAFLLAILPKCPFCWAGYSALAATLGLQIDTSFTWVVAGLSLAVLVGVACLWAKRHRASAAIASLGAALVLVSRFTPAPFLNYAGVAILFLGVLISVLRSTSSQSLYGGSHLWGVMSRARKVLV